MREIEADIPQMLPGQHVKLAAARTLGKDRAGDGDVSLQHAGEAVPHLRCRLSDRHRPGHVGGAVGILPARIRSEEHTSELQSLMRISYAVFCLKNKKKQEQR